MCIMYILLLCDLNSVCRRNVKEVFELRKKTTQGSLTQTNVESKSEPWLFNLYYYKIDNVRHV